MWGVILCFSSDFHVFLLIEYICKIHSSEMQIWWICGMIGDKCEECSHMFNFRSESSSEDKLVSDEEWCKITWIEVVKNARYLVDCLWLSRLPKHDLCSSLRYLKKWFYWMRASILKLNLWNLVPLNLWLLFILFVLAHIQISFVYTIMLMYEHLIFFFFIILNIGNCETASSSWLECLGHTLMSWCVCHYVCMCMLWCSTLWSL